MYAPDAGPLRPARTCLRPLLAAFLLAPAALPAAEQPLALTTASQVRALSPAEADRAQPVRLCGVITYDDPRRSAVFVQDRITGVSVVPFAEQLAPRSFHLLLRSPADVVILNGLPWWTARRALLLVAGVAALAL